MKKRLAALVAMTGLAWGLACTSALGQEYKGPIRIVVPFSAGGGTDVLARLLAPKISSVLSQPVIIENKPGASGQIGAQFVKGAPADGSTYLMSPESSVIIHPLITPNVPYTAQDFKALGLVSRYQWTLSVPASSGTTRLDDFVGQIQKKTMVGNYGVPIVGGVPDLIGRVLASQSQIELAPIVYAGGAPMMSQLVGAQIPAGVSVVSETLPMKQGAKVNVLAISGNKRSSHLPDVPTFEELGYKNLAVGSWNGFFAPRAMPAPVAERFNAALRTALADPEVRTKIAEMGMEIAVTTLPEAAQEFKSTSDFWSAQHDKKK